MHFVANELGRSESVSVSACNLVGHGGEGGDRYPVTLLSGNKMCDLGVVGITSDTA